MYSSAVDCETSSNEENITLVVPLTCVEAEVTGSVAMLVCQMERLGKSDLELIMR